jgi:hypothetical protein
MWGTSSPEGKLAGDLGNVIETTSTGGRRSGFFTAEKIAPGNLGLLQQYRHKAALASAQPCPLPVEADMRAFGRYSAFDPEQTFADPGNSRVAQDMRRVDIETEREGSHDVRK